MPTNAQLLNHPDTHRKRKKSVLLIVDRYLPASQAFIYQQAAAMRTYTPKFLTVKKLPLLVDHGQFEVHATRSNAFGFMAELLLKGPRIGFPALVPTLQRTQLLHAHFGKNGYVFAPLARAAGIPLIVTFHGFDATYNGPPEGVKGLNQRRFFKTGRKELSYDGNVHVVAVSDFVVKRLLGHGFAAERVFRHYVGVNLEHFSPSCYNTSVPGRIICISRFVEYKGHKYIVDALRNVSQSGRDIELILVGDGPLRDEIGRMAAAVLPRVKILSDLSQTEIRGLLRSSCMLVHGSVTLDNGHAEAFGVALLEAQAMNVPVVAFRSGGVVEAVQNGIGGILVDERDTFHMSKAIMTLLDDESLRMQMGFAGAEYVRRNYDILRQTEILERYYESIIEKKVVVKG